MGFDFVDTVAESVHGVYSLDADDIRVTGIATKNYYFKENATM